MFVLVILGLLCIEAEGGAREETLYVKTGTDLLLDVGEHVAFVGHESMSWIFQNKDITIELTDTSETVPNPGYVGRVELFPQNQSLLMKNVQKTDSGEYRVVSSLLDMFLVQYQVTVLDPVSDVKLEVKQCSSDRSDLTVTCTTLDGLLNSTFICENTTCSHEGGEKNIPPGASVKVYLKNGSVTCHHSNQVSSKEDTKTVEDLCGIKKNKVPDSSSAGVSLHKLKIIIVSVGLFIMVSAVISVHVMEKLNKTE